MRTWCGSKKAFAIIEYTVLIITIIAAMLVFRGYVRRSFQGQISRASDGFAYGRQYDPKNSMACVYNDKIFVWYSQACYDHVVGLNNCKVNADFLNCTYDAMRACTMGCEVGNGNN